MRSGGGSTFANHGISDRRKAALVGSLGTRLTRVVAVFQVGQVQIRGLFLGRTKGLEVVPASSAFVDAFRLLRPAAGVLRLGPLPFRVLRRLLPFGIQFLFPLTFLSGGNSAFRGGNAQSAQVRHHSFVHFLGPFNKGNSGPGLSFAITGDVVHRDRLQLLAWSSPANSGCQQNNGSRQNNGTVAGRIRRSDRRGITSRSRRS